MDTKNIDPCGEAILVVGPEMLRLRVNTGCLKWASKVFGVMFSGRFAEGNGLSSNTPKDISLPEDDPEHMLTLCNLLHSRHEQLPKNLDSLQLLQLACLYDKYGCAKAVSEIISLRWLQVKRDIDGLEEVAQLAGAAYLLDDTTAFGWFTEQLVCRYHSTTDLVQLDLPESVPKSVFIIHVFRLREHARKVLVDGLGKFCLNDDYVSCWTRNCPNNGVSRSFRNKLQEETWDSSRWGLYTISVGQICELLRSMDVRKWVPSPSGCIECTGVGGRYHDKVHHPTSTELIELVEHIENEVWRNICLECVKMGRKDLAACDHREQAEDTTGGGKRKCSKANKRVSRFI